MSKKSNVSEKWIISKINEHDKLIKDILQYLKEMKDDIESFKQGSFIIDVIHNMQEEEEEDEAVSPRQINSTS